MLKRVWNQSKCFGTTSKTKHWEWELGEVEKQQMVTFIRELSLSEFQGKLHIWTLWQHRSWLQSLWWATDTVSAMLFLILIPYNNTSHPSKAFTHRSIFTPQYIYTEVHPHTAVHLHTTFTHCKTFTHCRKFTNCSTSTLLYIYPQLYIHTHCSTFTHSTFTHCSAFTHTHTHTHTHTSTLSCKKNVYLSKIKLSWPIICQWTLLKKGGKQRKVKSMYLLQKCKILLTETRLFQHTHGYHWQKSHSSCEWNNTMCEKREKL